MFDYSPSTVSEPTNLEWYRFTDLLVLVDVLDTVSRLLIAPNSEYGSCARKIVHTNIIWFSSKLGAAWKSRGTILWLRSKLSSSGEYIKMWKFCQQKTKVITWYFGLIHICWCSSGVGPLMFNFMGRVITCMKEASLVD